MRELALSASVPAPSHARHKEAHARVDKVHARVDKAHARLDDSQAFCSENMDWQM